MLYFCSENNTRIVISKGQCYSCILITKARQRAITVRPAKNRADTLMSSAVLLHVWKNSRSQPAPIRTAKILARNLIRKGCSFDHRAISSHFLSKGDCVARMMRSTSSAVYFFLSSFTFTFDIFSTLLYKYTRILEIIPILREFLLFRKLFEVYLV